MDNDIEELHQAALAQGLTTYTDPHTGFMVFTEKAHLNRGTCCGNTCRHCPYGWINVASGQRRPPKVTNLTRATATATTLNIRSSSSDNNRELSTVTTTSAALSSSSRVPASTGGRHGGKHTTKNVPYTRGGDAGTSQLLTGERRSKADAAFEAMGTVDELCTVVGVAHAALLQIQPSGDLVNNDINASSDEIDFLVLQDWLLEIMSRLFDVGSHVAKPPRRRTTQRTKTNREQTNYSSDESSDLDSEDDEKPLFQADGVGGGFAVAHIDELEHWIDKLTDELPELTVFILPTGAVAAAQLHVARTVCRRAERRLVPLIEHGVCDPNAFKYLNRLSDFFFTAARWVNYKLEQDEIQYRRSFRGSKQRDRVVVALGAKAVVDKKE